MCRKSVVNIKKCVSILTGLYGSEFGGWGIFFNFVLRSYVLCIVKHRVLLTFISNLSKYIPFKTLLIPHDESNAIHKSNLHEQ